MTKYDQVWQQAQDGDETITLNKTRYEATLRDLNNLVLQNQARIAMLEEALIQAPHDEECEYIVLWQDRHDGPFAPPCTCYKKALDSPLPPVSVILRLAKAARNAALAMSGYNAHQEECALQDLLDVAEDLTSQEIALLKAVGGEA